MRIGRSALDEDAIRLIEEHNPEVEFDWTRILKGQDAPAEPIPAQQDRRGKHRPREFPPRPPGPRAPAPAAVQQTSEIPVPDIAIPPSIEPALESLPESAVLEELLAEPDAEGRSDRVAPEETTTAAQARLGSEGLSRLRARHSEVLARISETITDPVRRDELKSQADRLNPDTWVTEAEVTAGLEAYESVFESLRTVIGRRRKRRRRSAGRGPAALPGGPSPEASSPEPAGGEGPDTQDPGDQR